MLTVFLRAVTLFYLERERQRQTDIQGIETGTETWTDIMTDSIRNRQIQTDRGRGKETEIDRQQEI